MTFKELQDQTLEELGYDFNVPSSVPRTRIRRRLNEWHRRLLNDAKSFPYLRESHVWTFTSVASQEVYGLPLVAERIIGVTDETNEWALELKDVPWVRVEDPGRSASGTPTTYIVRGRYPVHTQPSTTAPIYVQSNNGADAQVARMEYLNAVGHRVTAVGVVTGDPTLDTATELATGVKEIYGFHLNGAAAGTVYLRADDPDADVGTELAALPAGATSATYTHVQLWPTPTAALTYRVDFQRAMGEMIYDTDVPLLPSDFHYLLSLGAQADEWRRKDDTRYEQCLADVEREKRKLTKWLWDTSDYFPGQDSGAVRGSRLGSWYPSGT